MKRSIFHCSHFCASSKILFINSPRASERGAFAREKCFISHWGGKKLRNKEKAFVDMHNAIKKLHSTQFVFLHSQPTRQSETAIFALVVSRSTPALMHETFIKLLFIAIDVFNGEIRNRFMIFQFNILQLSVCYSRFFALLSACAAGVSYMECFPSEPKKIYSASNIYMPYHWMK